jgi:hypothetical protein
MKKRLLILAIILCLGILVGGYALLLSHQPTASPVETQEDVQQQASDEDITISAVELSKVKGIPSQLNASATLKNGSDKTISVVVRVDVESFASDDTASRAVAVEKIASGESRQLYTFVTGFQKDPVEQLSAEATIVKILKA